MQKRVVLVVSSALQEMLREGRKSCQWALLENLRGNGQCEPPFPTVLRILFCVNRTKRAATAPPGPNYASLLAYAGSRQSSSHWQQSRFKLDHSVGIRRRNLHIIQRDLQTFCVYPTPSLCSMTANSRQLSVLGESASASVHWVGYEYTAGSASPLLTSNIAIEICTSCKSPTHRHLSDNHSGWVSD